MIYLSLGTRFLYPSRSLLWNRKNPKLQCISSPLEWLGNSCLIHTHSTDEWRDTMSWFCWPHGNFWCTDLVLNALTWLSFLLFLIIWTAEAACTQLCSVGHKVAPVPAEATARAWGMVALYMRWTLAQILSETSGSPSAKLLDHYQFSALLTPYIWTKTFNWNMIKSTASRSKSLDHFPWPHNVL